MNQTATQASKRRGASQAARKATTRDRCTLCLDPLMSMKLSIEAHRRNLDRSDTVNQILTDALRHIVISVREVSSVSASSADSVSLATPMAAAG